MKAMILAGVLAVAATGCQTAQVEAVKSDDMPTIVKYEEKPMAYIPKAVVYKTNGDYADNVAVNVDAQGRIISYPAPTDVTSASSALPLGDGWLLDRRGGVGGNTVFLSYTYEQYSKLADVPSLEQLKEHIIPGARVTQVRTLPIPASEAIADPAKARQCLE